MVIGRNHIFASLTVDLGRTTYGASARQMLSD